MHYFKLENTHTHTKNTNSGRYNETKRNEREDANESWMIKISIIKPICKTNRHWHTCKLGRGKGGGGEGGETGILASPTECLCGPQAFNSVSTVVRVIQIYMQQENFLVLNRVKQSEQILSWENSEFFSDPCSTPTNQLLSSTPKV